MVSVNDVFNRLPTISEDTLQYLLYLPPDQSDRISATSLAALLSDHVKSLIPGHLWHRDAFELKVAPDPEANVDNWVLEGRIRVGDCIDDEWCAVWLLRELSTRWDVVVSVFDSDGEFLLIEAADELPSWVTPTNAENRVWIHNSRLHLIPLSHVSPSSSRKHCRRYLSHRSSDDEDNLNEEDTGFITAADGIRLVRSTVDTGAPQNVQEVVWQRISGYPTASRQHMHVTNAYLPVDLVKALAINPQLVQKAVETFYTRDVMQLRAAQKMSRFPPEPATLTSVMLTRTAYAQLLGQKFHPPKAFGRWFDREGTKEWRWRDLGMKITCGFEMLYQESKNRKEVTTVNFNGSPGSTEALKDVLSRNPDYAQYIHRLVSAGYFKGEPSGSQLWASLENQAASAFIAARRDDNSSRPSFASAVQAAIAQYTEDYRPRSVEMDEDEDDWLNVDATDFDAMLEKTLGSGKGKGTERTFNAMDVRTSEDEEDCLAKAQAARLHVLAKKVEDFVEGEGDIEGARFADEVSSEDDTDDTDDTDDADDIRIERSGSTEIGQTEHAHPSYTSQLNAEDRAAHQEAMDRLVPGIDPSEYGKMPPLFHSNSQRVAPVTVEIDVRDGRSPDSTVNAAFDSRPIRPPILPRDDFDGVDSDDETDEDGAGDEADDDDDEHPQIVGDVEIDMAEEEGEFLEFARQALGVDDELWRSILREREERGAFVPTHVVSETQNAAAATTGPTTTPTLQDPQQDADGTLGSFEAVMRVMDVELARARGLNVIRSSSRAQDKGKTSSDDETDIDIEAAMEAELEGLMHRNVEDEENDAHGEQMDYQLIRHFLESFKGQSGLSGPVSTLVGRLQEGWTLPRDDS